MTLITLFPLTLVQALALLVRSTTIASAVGWGRGTEGGVAAAALTIGGFSFLGL